MMAEAFDDEVGGDLWVELQCPGADRFVAHVDATMREHLFNVTQAECVEPNGVLPPARTIVPNRINCQLSHDQLHPTF
jgi:hypothetical protein